MPAAREDPIQESWRLPPRHARFRRAVDSCRAIAGENAVAHCAGVGLVPLPMTGRPAEVSCSHSKENRSPMDLPVEVLANMQLSPPANRTARWTWSSGGARTSDQKTNESLDVWRDWPVAR